MSSPWNDLLKDCDEKIRAGHADLARKALQRLDTPGIPREFAVPLAALARRANLALLGLRTLRPWVRPAEGTSIRATSPEKAEYAAGLLRIGALSEAQGLLSEVDPNEAPEALLFQAYANFRHWNYIDSVPLLERFVNHPSVSPYQRLVGKTNLASSLVYVRRTEEARKLLQELLSVTREAGFEVLHGNALEYLAQMAITERDWRAASDYLRQSEAKLKGSGTLDELFVRKWRAVAALLQRPSDPGRKKALLAVRKDAVRMQHWETVRDCDQFLATSQRDIALFQHVYFGTPYPHFRRKLRERLGTDIEMPERYLWKPGHGSAPGKTTKKAANALAFAIETPPSEASGMRSGQLLQRLLVALAQDFYQPSRLTALHSALFPGDFFHPRSSAARVHQALKRLRQVIHDESWPLEISESDGSYRLQATGRFLLSVGADLQENNAPPGPDWHRLQQLRAKLGDREFSASEAARILGMTTRAFQRLATATQALQRTGAARATRYRFIA